MQIHIVLLSVVILGGNFDLANGYNILGIFPHPGISHFKFFQPVLEGLAEHGHKVVVVSYFPQAKPPANYKDVPLHGEILTNTVDLQRFVELDRQSLVYLYQDFLLLAEWGYSACNALISSPAVDEILKMHSKKPFDLVFTEFFTTDCTLGIAHKLNVPFIGASSCALMPWYYDRVSLPDSPSYIPSEFVASSEKMSFRERVTNFIITRMVKISYRLLVQDHDNKMLRQKFGPDMPHVAEIAKNTSAIFINQHYSATGAKPLTPQIVELGGIHVDNATRQLAKEFQTIIDSAKHGVVIISWGSMIKAETLPDDKRRAIVKAIAKFPQTFIWKWENETIENKPKNLIIKKWLPQKDILCQANVKGFISHAGLMGSTESVYCGVPMVVTPMYGDQFLNAASLVYRKMAILVEFDNITEASMTYALTKILSPEMNEAAKEISFSFRNRQNSPMDTALWWVDHVIKTKGHRLAKSYAAEMSWFTYYCLDVLLFLGLTIYSLMFCIFYISGKVAPILKRFFNKKTDKLKKK